MTTRLPSLTSTQKMLRALNATHAHIYAGTANPKTVAKRRAKNKVARASRRINRNAR